MRVDVERNQLEVTAPLEPGTDTWRHYAVVGLFDAESRSFLQPADEPTVDRPGGARGADPPPVFNVAFRFEEPIGAVTVERFNPFSDDPGPEPRSMPYGMWREHTQALALADRDVSAFHVDLDFAKLADGVSFDVGGEIVGLVGESGAGKSVTAMSTMRLVDSPGGIVEVADAEELFENPQHPYTQALLDAIPVPGPRTQGPRTALEGDVPSPVDPPSGCPFRTRCPVLIQPSGKDPDSVVLSASAREARLPEYGLDEESWRSVLRFTRAVRHRTFTLEDDADLDERFVPSSRPDSHAGDVIAEAIELLRADEWDTAAELLELTFEENSICAVRRPSYAVEPEHGDDAHDVACHHHRH